MPRRWHTLVSALLLAVLSGTPALAAVCLGWCDDPATATIHHGGAHDSTHDGHEMPAPQPSAPDTPSAPCHGGPGDASGPVLLDASPITACDDALAAAEAVAPGGTRLDSVLMLPPALHVAAEPFQAFLADRASPRADAAPPGAAARRAPLALRI